MAEREFILIEVPQGAIQVDTSQITKAKTVGDLDRICTRFTDTLEEDLKKRLYVSRQDKNGNWKAEPKIKKIYKYHLSTSQPQVTNNDVKRKRKVRSLKKHSIK